MGSVLQRFNLQQTMARRGGIIKLVHALETEKVVSVYRLSVLLSCHEVNALLYHTFFTLMYCPEPGPRAATYHD